MKVFDDAIERGLALFAELLHGHSTVEREYRRSLSAFAGGSAAGERADPLRERRHLEWFVLQRPCETLGEVPLVAWAEEWSRRAEPDVRDVFEAFQGSHASAFEVIGLEPGGTVWSRDLFGLGEYALVEPAAAQALQVGDLVVGRLFPVEGGAFRLSAAASAYRNRGLVDALKSDLERARATRRGSLRVQQDELERLFHRAGGELVETPPTAAETRARLVEAGAPGDLAGEVVEALERSGAEAGGAAVAEALDLFAFETEVDLEEARRALVEHWDGLRRRGAGQAVTSAPEGAPGTAGAGENGTAQREAARDAASALARFDAGRAEGRDLEGLFRTLERDLGIEAEEAADEGVAPDYPGVVGAVVGEYLWDVGREDPERGRAASVLHALSRFGAEIGVFEELGERDLIDFAGRWLLDEEPESALRVVGELGPFARWCEEQHAHPLWTRAGEALEGIAAELPRLLRARRALAGLPRAGAPWWSIAAVEEEGLRLVELGAGGRRERTLPPDEDLPAADLRAGDLVRVEDDRVVAVYPAELGRLIASPTR